MIDCANMTHLEVYRVNGTLSTERLESLLDASEQAIDTDVSNWKATLQEARSCYLSEDFLDARISDLQALAKSLRGNNRQALFDIIATIQDDVLQAVQSSEYGADEIGKILKVCK
jgi:hypothetical protein